MSASSGQATVSAADDHILTLDKAAITVWRRDGNWHGFLGRGGGVSRGPYASLNFSYLAGDSPAAVQTNWARLKRCFPPGVEFVQVHQVHGDRIHVADSASRGVSAVADGMVSATSNVILGILTADCVPILLMDADARVVGALHAGWRGVLANILASGVRAMKALGARPQRIQSALGPAIGPCCFEVDIELARRFEKELPQARGLVSAASGAKAHIDLKGIIGAQLLSAGLETAAISDVAVCTRCAGDRFFSRRGAGGGATGLQLSFIGLRE
jgi:polyphenol oxidase